MNLSELQQKVYHRARELLVKEKWFRGVCFNNFPEDEEITKKGVEECAKDVYWETHYWDANKFSG